MMILFIWDFDGVIADTPHEEAWLKACEFYGIKGFDHNFYEEYVSGFTSYEGSRNILEKLGFFKNQENNFEHAVNDLSNLKLKIYLSLIEEGKYSLNLSVLNFILKARSKGVIQALASASNKELIKIIFKRSNLEFNHFFDIDVSGTGINKYEIFRNALNETVKKFGHVKKVFVFEDAMKGVKAARELGFITIGCFNEKLKNYGVSKVIENFANLEIESILS